MDNMLIQTSTNVNSILTITLNRPQAMNALNTAMRDALIAILQSTQRNDAVRAAVITGAGERAFSSGQDLEEASAFSQDDVAVWLQHQRLMFQSLREFEKPIVAAFNGVAAGAGFQIGLLCDLRIGYAEMRIGQPEVRAGLASVIGSYLMSEFLPHGKNVELSLSGKLITGSEAHGLGLLTQLVPRDEVLNKAAAAANELAAQPQLAVALTKRRFREVTQANFDAAIEAAIQANKIAYGTGLPQNKMREFLKQRSKT